MPGPGGREVGRVSVRALPDTSAFARSLERYLERLERTLRVEIPVDLDNTDVANAEGVLNELSRDRKVNVAVDVDTSLLDRLQKTLAKTGGSAPGGVNPSGLATALQGTLGLVTAAAALLPVISTLVLALPGLVAAIAAPIAAILLGLDGIKKAAEVLVVPFQRMIQAVSGTFERALTPVFRQLRAIMGPLTRGMQQIAESLSGMLSVVVDSLTSNNGLALISSTFDQLAKALDILAPSLGPLTDAFLTLINEGMKQFVEIAPALAGLNETFAKFIAWADETGVLAAAFDFLGNVILGLVGLFFGLVVAGTVLAAMWENVRVAITNFVTSVPENVRAGLDQVVAFFQQLPGRISGAIGGLPGLLTALALTAMAGFLSGIVAGAGRVIGFVAGIPGMIRGAVGDLSGVLFNAGVSLIAGFINGIKSKLAELGGVLEGMAGGAISIVKKKLGIESPSKEFAKLGAFSAEGFVQGFENQMRVGWSFEVPDVRAGSAFLAGTSLDASSTGSSRQALTITNWHDGTGYIEDVSDGRVDAGRGEDGMIERAFG